MAFYALFSLFPLLILLVVIASFFLLSPQAYDTAIRLLGQFVPVSRSAIRDIISGVLEQRSAVTLLGLVGLAFSASSLFSAVATNINRAWPTARRRRFFRRQLTALAVVGLVVVLLVLSIFVRVAVRLIVFYGRLGPGSLPILGWIPVLQTWLLAGISGVVRWVLACLIFLAIYRWVPRTRVPWSSALWAALVAGSAWELAAFLFTWYLGAGLVQYELIYGSLGAIITLMVWFYLTALILLFGAHLSSAITEYLSLRPATRSNDAGGA